MTKNFKKMIEDGLEQHEIRFDFERKSLYTIINDFLNIHPEQKVFYANGFFLKIENETRYYLKEKNLSLFWKRYADRIHCIHERFVNIIFPVETLVKTNNSFSVFEDAQWIKIGDQYQVYIDNVDSDILEDILTFAKANDTSCFVRTERNTDRDCSFFFFCNQEIYDRLCTKECEQI